MEGRGLPPGCPDSTGAEQAACTQGDGLHITSSFSARRQCESSSQQDALGVLCRVWRPEAALCLRTGKSSLGALPSCMSCHHTRSYMQVVHCDLKAKNVLLTKDRLQAKIGDVGLARMMAETHLSSVSGFFGTFAYTAPEVLGRKRCDEKVPFTAACPEKAGPCLSRAALSSLMAETQSANSIGPAWSICLTHPRGAAEEALQQEGAAAVHLLLLWLAACDHH